MNLVDLIRHDKLRSKLTCKYIKPYNSNWTDIEILENITQLFASSRLESIKKIPTMPNLIKLYCSHNQLEEIEYMPKLEILFCGYNRLRKISAPNLKYLSSFNNQLNEIEFMTNLKQLNSDNNSSLLYTDLNGYKEWYRCKFRETLNIILIFDLCDIVIKYIIDCD